MVGLERAIVHLANSAAIDIETGLRRLLIGCVGARLDGGGASSPLSRCLGHSDGRIQIQVPSDLILL
jgi:hypothetical protein